MACAMPEVASASGVNNTNVNTITRNVCFRFGVPAYNAYTTIIGNCASTALPEIHASCSSESGSPCDIPNHAPMDPRKRDPKKSKTANLKGTGN